MLDLEFVRQNPAKVKEMVVKRKVDPKKADVDLFLKLDQDRRQLLTAVESLRRQRNELSSKFGQTKDKSLVDQVKSLKKELEILEKKLGELNKQWQEIYDWLPNICFEDTPEGKEEEDNIVVAAWHPELGQIKEGLNKRAGDFPKLMPDKPANAAEDFKPQPHYELGPALDLIDLEQSAKVSGSRFYYYKNEMVLIEYALKDFMMKKLLQEGFSPYIPPLLVKERVLYGTSHFPEGRDQVYRLDKYNVEEEQQLYLVGSAEPSLFAYWMDKTLDQKELPVKMMAFTSCFRSEVGSWGRDVRGTKRVHQFDKLEMTTITEPDKSREMVQYLLSLNEWLFQQLKIPYRIVRKCYGDCGYPASAEQYDPEAWISSTGEFMEIGTATNTTDYQARRLNIKYTNDKGERLYPHTLNNTAIAMSRMPIAILDHYQQKDGSVVVPEVLQSYVGKDKIQK